VFLLALDIHATYMDVVWHHAGAFAFAAFLLRSLLTWNGRRGVHVQAVPAGPFAPASIEITEAVVNDSTCHYYMRYVAPDGSYAYVVRRYSEFDSLRGTIAAAAATVEPLAPFPPKYYFGAWQAHVVQERKSGLADWVNALLALAAVPQELVDFLSLEDSDKEVTKEMLARLEDPLVAQKGSTPDMFVQYKIPHGDDGKHFACNHDSCMTIELAESGPAARAPTTLTALFDMCKDLGGSTKAMWWEEPQDDGTYQPREWTWQQYHEDTMAAACSFIALGVETFGSVSIIGFNSPQWSMACVGAIACGAKAAGIYATNEPDACQYIVEHSESTVVVVENDAQLKKFTDSGILAQLPKVKALVQYTGSAINEERISNAGSGVQVLTWAQFLEVGANDATLKANLEERKAAQKPGHCCSLIYTSGTTGPPKAVMISHDNACWTSMAFLVNEPGISEPGGEHDIVSYLPLSHIAAQALDIFFPIVGTSGLGEGAAKSFKICVTFARPDALRGSLKDTLNVAKPTVFFAVPRVWEKFSEAIQAKARQGQDTMMGQVTKSLGSWAKGKVGEAYHESQAGGAVGWTPMGYTVASKLVAKAQQALGLERCKWMYTGAAPITKETLEYFGSIGIKILELCAYICFAPTSVFDLT
jgi:acyl-CoA synthetase (AMP-forming)/AMP-acid ligase II